MSKPQTSSRRKRVPGAANRNIYSREDARGGTVYEIGYRDGAGKQRFETVGPNVTAARGARDRALAKRGSGEPVSSDPRLTFGEAADRFLAEQAINLRPETQASYRNSIRKHLKPRFAARRLGHITVDEWAVLVGELRAEGLAESTIESIIKAGRRVYRFAARRMNWRGVQPISLLEPGERPKVSAGGTGKRRRLFSGDELAQTLAAATGVSRDLFTFAAAVGGRVSECLAVTEADFDLADLREASVRIEFQIDKKGVRRRLKTEASRRDIEVPYSVAKVVAERIAVNPHRGPDAFVFATRTGTPISRRNASRELRKAMKAARTLEGQPSFPLLHEVDDEGNPIPVKRGELPSFHSFRHRLASDTVAEGGSAEEAAWLLGHKDATVTQRIYVHEIKSAQRSAKRRRQLERRIGATLGAVADLEQREAA